ncbi:MAG: serine hydrolase domain-containing protein, partial [Acidimicrobiales bacterium]
DPIGQWVPELASPRVLRRPDCPLDDTVPAERPITVRDLLTFTFGFGVNADLFAADPPWPVALAEAELRLSTLGPPNPGAQPSTDEWMAGLGSLPLIAQPGQQWLYNTGASVLGVLMARATGTTPFEVLRTRIFEPLGMRDTAFFTEDTARLATLYEPHDDGLSVSDPPEGMWSHSPQFEDGAAGLVSTVDDLAAFGRAMVSGGGPILSPGAVAEMTADHLSAEQRARDGSVFLPDGSSWGYCLSVVVEGPRAGAFGWDGGLGTSWIADPARDLNVIVLTQLMFTSPTPPAIHAAVQAAAYDALG